MDRTKDYFVKLNQCNLRKMNITLSVVYLSWITHIYIHKYICTHIHANTKVHTQTQKMYKITRYICIYIYSDKHKLLKKENHEEREEYMWVNMDKAYGISE